jgi:hypothetical protein
MTWNKPNLGGVSTDIQTADIQIASETPYRGHPCHRCLNLTVSNVQPALAGDGKAPHTARRVLTRSVACYEPPPLLGVF